MGENMLDFEEVYRDKTATAFYINTMPSLDGFKTLAYIMENKFGLKKCEFLDDNLILFMYGKAKVYLEHYNGRNCIVSRYGNYDTIVRELAYKVCLESQIHNKAYKQSKEYSNNENKKIYKYKPEDWDTEFYINNDVTWESFDDLAKRFEEHTGLKLIDSIDGPYSKLRVFLHMDNELVIIHDDCYGTFLYSKGDKNLEYVRELALLLYDLNDNQAL